MSATGLPDWLEGQLPRGRSMTLRYAEVRGSLQTGDVILFAGTSLFHRLVQTVTRSIWSHAAMVVRDGDTVLCWESGKKGVRQHDLAIEYRLSWAVATCQAVGEKVAVRLLDCERTEAMLAAYRTFRGEVEGRPFERDKLELVKAALGIDVADRDLSSLFCSELLAETWQRMGLLARERDSNWFSPKDFSSLGSVTPLTGSLGEEILLEA